MQNMAELYAAHDTKRRELELLRKKVEEHYRIIEKHKSAIRHIEKKRDKLWDSFSWVSMLVKPLAEALKQETGSESFKTYGPFGLRAYVSIYVHKGQKCGGITLTLDSEGRLRYDTGEKTCRYDSNSTGIGALNGMDNVTAPLPDDISEIASLLRWFDATDI